VCAFVWSGGCGAVVGSALERVRVCVVVDALQQTGANGSVCVSQWMQRSGCTQLASVGGQECLSAAAGAVAVQALAVVMHRAAVHAARDRSC
jgi:hypothetical protein